MKVRGDSRRQPRQRWLEHRSDHRADAWAFEKAFFFRCHREHGFVLGDRMVTLA